MHTQEFQLSASFPPRPKTTFMSTLRPLAVGIAITFAVVACTPTEEVRGYVPNEAAIAKLKPGLDNRRNVARLIGSPSSISTFESKTWYYISKRSEHLAFFDEKVLDQQVVAIDFDDNGMISDMRRYKLDDARNIVMVGRITPTRGREMGLLEQIFGNVGRFATDGAATITSPTGGGGL